MGRQSDDQTVVLVCGGRDYFDRLIIDRTLNALHQEFSFTKLVDGEAQGADSIAHYWATTRGLRTRRYPAAWSKLGKAAGHLRNQQMLELEHPDFVVAFPGEKGTADMINRTRQWMRSNPHVRLICVDRHGVQTHEGPDGRPARIRE